MLDSQRLVQIGIVVKNLEEAMKWYGDVLGLGPFSINDLDAPNAQYYGETRPQHLKIAMCKLGPVALELIEVLSGSTVHADQLRERGEGIDHFCLQVDDLKATLKELEAKGLEVIEGDVGMGFAYVNMDKIGGVKLELVQLPEGFKFA